MTAKLWTLFLVLALALGAFAASCGGDDDDDNDTTDDDTSDDDSGDDDDTNTLTGHVRNFQDKQEVSGVAVQLLNNDTGEPFDPAITGTSDADGFVSFEIPAGIAEVAVLTTSEGFMDTLQYSFAADATDEEFLIVANQTIDIVSNLLGVTLDDAASHAAGAVYWGDPTDENPIGCAAVTIDPAPAEPVHYFGNDALPTADRDDLGTNPQNGYFIGLNAQVAATTMAADANGNANEVNIPKLYASTVVIQNFYYSKDDFSSLDELMDAACE